MSEQQNVTTPVGSAAAPAGAQALDELARRLRPARRIGRHPEPDRGLELLGLRRVEALPRGQHAGRRRAGQQRERGRRERVDVARARRDCRRRRAPGRGSRACRRATRGTSGADERPKSTSLIRPPLVRIRLPGLTSPWMTGGDCECRCVSASAAWAR